MKRKMTHDQAVEYVRGHFAYMANSDIVKATGYSIGTIWKMAREAGVTKDSAGLRKRISDGMARSGRCIGDKFDQYIKDHFHCTTNLEICEKLGISHNALQKRAKKLGLKKDDEFVRNLRSRGLSDGRSKITAESIARQRRKLEEIRLKEIGRINIGVGQKTGIVVSFSKKSRYDYKCNLEKSGYTVAKGHDYHKDKCVWVRPKNVNEYLERVTYKKYLYTFISA